MAEFAFEAISWILEFALDLVSDGDPKRNDDDDAIRRYTDSLHEERQPPPATPQDLN